MTPADSAWLDSAKELLRSNPIPSVECVLRFAIGKYCDDVGDYDQAFQNYSYANKLSLLISNNQYDPDGVTVEIDKLIRTYDSKQLIHADGYGSDSTRPIFVVGMPRSGTSLLEQIIASHPDAFGSGERNFWEQARLALVDPDTKLSNVRLRELADGYLQHLSGFNRDAIRVVDKMPMNFIHLGLIHSVFPNAKIIHVIRNPVDTCLSIYFQNFAGNYNYANDLRNLSHFYREYHRLMEHWRSVLPREIFMDVPYESLLADQEGWSRKIIEFTGLDWNERCLNFHSTDRSVVSASAWQVRQKIYKTSVERWRNYEKFIGPLLELKNL